MLKHLFARLRGFVPQGGRYPISRLDYPDQQAGLKGFPACFGNHNEENSECPHCGFEDMCEKARGNCHRLRTRKR